jgi:hypothetical protein
MLNRTESSSHSRDCGWSNDEPNHPSSTASAQHYILGTSDTRPNMVRVHGKLQKVENAKERSAYVILIKATQVFPLEFSEIETRSRDFH